jgi:hypothetical protein
MEEGTVITLGRQLRHLARYADIHDPESVKHFIANKKKKDGDKCSNAYKDILCLAYNRFCKFYERKWEMPTYTPAESIPNIPTEKQINTLIAGAGKMRVRPTLGFGDQNLIKKGLFTLPLCY